MGHTGFWTAVISIYWAKTIILEYLEILTATIMKMTVCWDVTLISLMMEAVSFTETSICIYQTTWRNITEYSHRLNKFYK
jgi:hypothetical protein